MRRLGYHPRVIVKYPLYPEDFKPVDDFVREYGGTLYASGCCAEGPSRGPRPEVKSRQRFVRAYRVAPEDADAIDAFIISRAKARRVDEL